MTPYEFSIVVRGFSLRKEQDLQSERALLVEHALLLSRWVWQKKIKKQDIEKLLKVEEQQKEMNDEQMFAKVKALNTLFGGEVRIVDGK